MSFDYLRAEFAQEALGLLEALEKDVLALERGARDDAPVRVAAARRTLHTLKGNAGLVGASALQAALHAMEDVARHLGDDPAVPSRLLDGIDSVRRQVRAVGEAETAQATAARPQDLGGAALGAAGAAAAPTWVADEGDLRLPQRRIDDLVAAAGDLLVQNAAVQKLAGRGTTRALAEAAERLDGAVRRVHQHILAARTVPVGQLFTRLQRVVRDEARAAHKQLALELAGGEVEADKAVLDRVFPALVHLVRNAVAHGVELPDQRKRAGKPAAGRLGFAASTQGNTLRLELADDGAGLDREAIVRRARELGLDPSLPPEELIFEAGLSTAAAITASAGRGIGLDAVRRSVFAMAGTLEVQSERGRGTVFRIGVPISIALQRALLCGLGDEVYALPVTGVLEATRFDERHVRWLGAGRALEHRGALVPLVDEADLLGAPASGPGFVVFVQAGAVAALRVGELLGQQDFVFQPLPHDVVGRAPVSAAALWSDGRVVLRLDPDALVHAAARRSREVRA